MYKGDSIIYPIENYTGDQHELLINPNPASEKLYVQPSNGEQISQASIFGLNGRMLLSVPLEQFNSNHALYQLSLSDLDASEIRVLQVKTSAGKTMSERFFYSR